MVLVVDDDEGVRAVMATALEDEGWQVETAANGRLALSQLTAKGLMFSMNNNSRAAPNKAVSIE